ncbi:nucleoside diphosphatase [Neurospora intermedia]|uniref:Nucleoside diphosphatase n=1 Tax=Neurospora intermedia TaxID=5142 RepID=A0ABR3DHL0_NEUIN
MGKDKNWRWGVILDAGSSGTRLHIYRWKDPEKALGDASPEELRSLPKITTKKKWTKKIRPGISTFGEKAGVVGEDYLKELIDHALDIIPADKIHDTPIFLMATAGMRLLPQVQQNAITGAVCTYLRKNTKFSLPDCDLHIQVIPGETEGLYGWIASNYLLGGFDHPEQHAHGQHHHTYGFLDMGGASAQIAFAPNSTEAQKHANDLKLLRLRTLDGSPVEYKVFTTTWLGFGVNRAREAYVQSLSDLYTTSDAGELPDPCLPKGLRLSLDGTPVSKPKKGETTLIGTGAFDECLRKTYPLLGKDKPCADDPCLINGQHVPAIDFDVNHFVGVSEYWHTTHGVFGGKENEAYDFTTYQKRVKDFCGRDWNSIEPSLDAHKKFAVKDAQEACFKASWLINILHEGIGVPRIGVEELPAPGLNASKGAIETAKQKGFLDPFHPVDKIDGIEVSWTLGKMVLYAAGQVPPKTGDDRFPVGFGTNIPSAGATELPPDFQYAGSTWTPLSGGASHNDPPYRPAVNGTTDDGSDWDLEAENLLGKTKAKTTHSLLIVFFIFLALLFFFRKKDRRMRFYGRVNNLFHKPRRSGLFGKMSSSGHNNGPLSSLTNKLFGRRSLSSGSYERVLEEGEAAEFELNDSHFRNSAFSYFDHNNDLNGFYSDSSDSSSSGGGRSKLGITSGLATPKLNLDGRFADLGCGNGLMTPGGSALDRAGLVVRTDSRERLGLTPTTTTMSLQGRRSRAGSPTRLKSPLMSPSQG